MLLAPDVCPLVQTDISLSMSDLCGRLAVVLVLADPLQS